MKLVYRLKQDVVHYIASECCYCITGFNSPIDPYPGIVRDPMRCLSNLEGWTVPEQQRLLMRLHQ